MEYIAIIVSIFALVASIYGIWYSKKYSEISILNGVQELMLAKAKDCNILWQKAEKDSLEAKLNGWDSTIGHKNPILEISTSLELLNNCLNVYSIEKKKQFLLSQFWTQLDFELRAFVKDEKTQDKVKGYGLNNVQTTFKDFHSVLW